MNDLNTAYWLIEYGAAFTEYYLSLFFCGTWIGQRASEKKTLPKILACAAISFVTLAINRVDLYSPVSVLLGVFLIIALQLAFYHRSAVKAAVSGLIFLLLMVLLDNVTVSMISWLSGLPSADIYQELSLYRVLAIVTSKTLLLLMTVAVCRFFSGKETPERKYLLPLTAITVVMFVLTVAITFMDIKRDEVNSETSVLFFAMMLILLLILFFGAYRLTEYYESLRRLQLADLRNQMLERSLRETEQTFTLWKTSVHDYKHSIVNLTALAKQGDMQGISEYLARENELLGQQLFYYKTGNETVDTILNIKKKTAEDKGIPFLIHAQIPLDCGIAPADFASLLGNLLDNAIEASAFEADPYIEVRIKPVKDYLILNISNRCTKPNETQKTEKPQGYLHGIGLQSVRQTVSRYDGEFTAEQDGEVFEALVMLPL